MIKMQENESLFMSIPQVRRLLNLGKTSTKVYDIIRNNNIEYIVVGNRWEILRSSLYNYLNIQLEKSTQ